MARTGKGIGGFRDTIAIESAVDLPIGGGTDVTVTIASVARSWWTLSRVTAHWAVYAAARDAMRAADARGVTHLR